MLKRYTRILIVVMVISSVLLASCGGTGGDLTPTVGVPVTGATLQPTVGIDLETPAGGLETVEPTGTMAATEDVTTPAVETTPEATEAGGDTGGPVTDALTWTPEQIGGTVTVLAIWGGEELDNFNAMIQPFQEQTGIQVQVESTRDIGAVLNTRIQGGNPPDVAGLPNPGQMNTLARNGDLVPLDDVLDMEGMRAVYDAGFLDLATVDGQMYGIFTKAAVKSLVWYNPQVFEANGFEVPTTWDELKALEQQMVDTGAQPWCVGIDGGAGSGWPGTDWVEDIMLRTGGPEVYDQWWQHEIPWTDDAVRTAFETWGEIVTNPNIVYGGPQTVIATNFGEAFIPMFEDPAGCYMHRQASFITTFFQEQFPELQAGEDYTFFEFPPIDEAQGNPLLVAGDLFGMFNDTPQARALLQYLVTAEAQSIWAERGGFLSANKSVDPAVYPDQITQQIGEMIASADAVRFDASDLMPEGVNSAFSQAVLQYVSAPDTLDQILEQVEGVAAGEYEQAP